MGCLGLQSGFVGSTRAAQVPPRDLIFLGFPNIQNYECMSVCMYASKSRTSKICDTRDASQGPPLPREKMMDGWMEGGREGGRDGGRDGWMDRWMDGCMFMSVCMYL